MDRRTDRRTDGQTDKSYTHRHTSQTDKQMDGCTDGRTDRQELRKPQWSESSDVHCSVIGTHAGCKGRVLPDLILQKLDI